jgi:hypothetical protein
MFGPCPRCNGQGFVQMPDKQWLVDPYCNGTGEDPGVPDFFIYKYDITLTALQLLPNQRITIGLQPFRIELLTRVKQGDFRIRLFDNSGASRSSAGTGAAGTNDRVRDACMFGDGQLPFVVAPWIIIDAGGSISFDLEDVSNGNNAIQLTFIGSKLSPTPRG